MDTVHPSAAQGFGAGADTYAKGRPDYPAEVADWLRHDLGLGAGKVALDLGSGTGKFLPRLVATGAAVIAVEPLDAMRAKIEARHPEVDARKGTAEAIPVADASVDALVCAQSFHWFANASALGEIRRVLKPGAALGLIWNVRDQRVPWVAALAKLLEPYEGDTPRYHRLTWGRLFPAEGFTPLRERHFRHAHIGTPEAVIVDRMLSISFVAALPQAEQDKIAAAVRALIARTPELQGRAEVSFPYDTAVFWTVKAG